MHIRIFNHYVQSPFILLAVLEFAVLVPCAYASVVFASGVEGPSRFIFDFLNFQYALIYAVVMLLSSYSMGVYGAALRESLGGMLARSMVSYCLLGGSAMVILYYLLPALYVGRGALFGAVVLSLPLVIIVRLAFYSVVDAAQLKRRILVLGTGRRASAILQAMKSGQFIGCDIVGFVRTDSDSLAIPEEWLTHSDSDMRSLVKKHRIDEIVVAVDERRRDSGSYFPIEELLDCKLAGTRITEVVELYERELSRIDLAEINTGWMVFGDRFRYNQLRDAGKRVFDIFCSLLLLTLAWPLMLLTALVVCLETGFPVIYKQTRVGLNGQHFSIYKFRSMTQDAEKDGKAIWAKANDSRVTRVGAFIRNTRLDELPQIINVLLGQMTFVGPRPERPEFVDDLVKELPYYDVRHRVKPGLMGWAQLKYPYGASVEDAANKLMYDLYYVKNYSVLLDMLIIVQSVEVILLGKGVR